MGTLQQGFNQALTGATFLLQQTPQYKEMAHKKMESREIADVLKQDVDLDIDYDQYKQRALAIGREDLYKSARHRQLEALKLKVQRAKAVAEAAYNQETYTNQTNKQKNFRDQLKGIATNFRDQLKERARKEDKNG